MIPFRDNIPSRTFPIWTVTLIVVNAVIFIYEVTLPERYLNQFIFQFGMVPARFLDLSEGPIALARNSTMPFFTSMFLHAGWMHLIGNMWYLWIFGDNVEDRLGHGRYLFFYLTCGILAGWTHLIFNLNSEMPSVGASGAIAGVLGAYLVTFPRARILTLLPIFVFWQIIELPAVLVLGVWFLMQLLSGTAAIAMSTQTAGGVAWWAHAGGFLSGMVLMKALQPRRHYWEN